jgi:putative transposase
VFGKTNTMRLQQEQLSGHPYVYLDGIYLKRNWGGGEYENVSILVAIGVDEDGYREIIGAAEGMKEDRESLKFVYLANS